MRGLSSHVTVMKAPSVKCLGAKRRSNKPLSHCARRQKSSEMAEFDEKALLEGAKSAFALDVKGWEPLFEDLGFKAWRKTEEVTSLSLNLLLFFYLFVMAGWREG